MAGRAFALKAGGLVLLVLAALFAQFYFDASSYFDPGRIRLWLKGAGMLAPLLYMLVMAVAIVVSPIPSLPLNFAAGAFFGPLRGTLYSLAGALAGAVASFLIARYLGRSVIERLVGGHVNFCTRCSDWLLTRIVFVARLIPLVSFDVVSYGAGLTRMSLSRFSLATLLGMVPFTALYNYSGSVIMFREGTAFVAGIVMVALFFLLPAVIERTGYFPRIRDYIHGKAGGHSGDAT